MFEKVWTIVFLLNIVVAIAIVINLYEEFNSIEDEVDLNELLKENYIPKDKIKKKIEELNNYYKKEVYPIKYQWADVDITEFYDSQIDLLEDLLKGE